MNHAVFQTTATSTPSSRTGTRGRRGFTLVEILIVVTIIIIIVLMALPAFNFITGSKSIDGAQNIIASVIGRARARAIGLQQPTGVFFFEDPNNSYLTTCVLVQVTPTCPTDAASTVYFDLIPNADYFPLPSKVSAQFINQYSTLSTSPNWDRYIAYNTAPANTVAPPSGGSAANPAITTPYGGVILFDSFGRLYPTAYGFRIYDQTIATGNDQRTAMAMLLNRNTGGIPTAMPTTPSTSPDFVPPHGQMTQFGFVLYNTDLYRNLGFIDIPNPNATPNPIYYSDPSFDPGSTNNGNYLSTTYFSGSIQSAQNADYWLDQNSTPLLINRYNGTLTRAE